MDKIILLFYSYYVIITFIHKTLPVFFHSFITSYLYILYHIYINNNLAMLHLFCLFSFTFITLLYLVIKYKSFKDNPIFFYVLFSLLVIILLLSGFILVKYCVLAILKKLLISILKINPVNFNSNNANFNPGGHYSGNNGGKTPPDNQWVSPDNNKKRKRANSYSWEDLKKDALREQLVKPDPIKSDYKELAAQILRGVNKCKKEWISLENNGKVRVPFNVYLKDTKILKNSEYKDILLKFANNYMQKNGSNPVVRNFCLQVLSGQNLSSIKIFNDPSFQKMNRATERIELDIIQAIIDTVD